MDQLPNHKVPRVNTPGERYRDLQLIRQLPKQDLSDRYCKGLEDPSETKEFRIFRELRDQVAMDIGTVKEAPIDTVRGLVVCVCVRGRMCIVCVFACARARARVCVCVVKEVWISDGDGH